MSNYEGIKYHVPNEYENEEVIIPVKVPNVGKSFTGFAQKMAYKESRGILHLVNPYGYMGKYQFGRSTLRTVGIYDFQEFLRNAEWQDEAFKAYMEENPEAANSNAAIKGVDRSLKGASNLASATIKNMFLPSEGLGKAFDKSKQIFMSDVEREEYNKKLDEAKAKEAQESLKSNNKDDKAKSGNISFEDYWSLKKQQQTLDNAELGKLQEELGKKSLTYSDNLANKYGVDEIKSVPKEMTPHEARIYATKNAVNSLVGRGVDPENALKLGLEEGEKAFKFQTNYINNVNENAKETAKNRYTEVKEEKKVLQDQIKTLESRKFDIGKNKESKIVYNGSTVKLSEVQDSLDNEISRLKKELAELK